MSDTFLLDRDYKDFDFTNKENLKFQTVYGEQHGNIFQTVVVCILLIPFTIILVSIPHEWAYMWNGAHTFGFVTQTCQGSQNWYGYSFEAEDNNRTLRQYTGRVVSNKGTPCLKAGDSIRVQYVRYDPNTSREYTGEQDILSNICGDGFVLILLGYFAYSSVGNTRAILQARPQYARLKQRSMLINGKLTNASKADNQWSYGYYIEVDYEFMLDRQVFTGTQIKRRDDLKGKPLPQYGLPVKILYADDSAYVML